LKERKQDGRSIRGRVWPIVMGVAAGWAAVFGLSGCWGQGGADWRRSTEAFVPTEVRFVPSFTRVVPGDKEKELQRRIEAYVSLTDQYGDTLKALGVFRFELFRHKPGSADERGQRFAIGGMQEFDLTEVAANQEHWDRTTRYYRFVLDLPGENPPEAVVVQVTFSLSAEVRLEDHITISLKE